MRHDLFPIEIIYEDDFILVVGKPAGLPVHSLKTSPKETLAGLLAEKYPELAFLGKPGEAGIVHRLDNTTSGLTVVARTQEVYDHFRLIWNTGDVKKNYTALVLGKTKFCGIITSPIAHHPGRKKKMMVCESPDKARKYGGRAARTEFEKQREYVFGKNFYSLLDVKITTGARHQIRVHLASLGHPLAGDRLYQSALKRKQDVLGLARPFLHLSHVTFPHPKTHRLLHFHRPLAGDLEEILRHL